MKHVKRIRAGKPGKLSACCHGITGTHCLRGGFDSPVDMQIGTAIVARAASAWL
jgi:hypothetical protein